MASVVISGDSSGSITLSAPSAAGTTTQTLVATSGTLAPLVAGTAVSASGTSIDFTSIPSWVKRITVMLNGVSLSSTSILLFQIGTSGGIQNSGYSSVAQASSTAVLQATGFGVLTSSQSTASYSGSVVITLLDSANGTWTQTGTVATNTGSVAAWYSSGSKTLSGTLDRIRITSVNGTDTFDAGSINIMYE